VKFIGKKFGTINFVQNMLWIYLLYDIFSCKFYIPRYQGIIIVSGPRIQGSV